MQSTQHESRRSSREDGRRPQDRAEVRSPCPRIAATPRPRRGYSGEASVADIPGRRVAATPRPRRGPSVETGARVQGTAGATPSCCATRISATSRDASPRRSRRGSPASARASTSSADQERADGSRRNTRTLKSRSRSIAAPTSSRGCRTFAARVFRRRGRGDAAAATTRIFRAGTSRDSGTAPRSPPKSER